MMKKKRTESSTKSISILKAIGPGFLLAGAAIGVSHLVQATRAGADYGFGLVWVLILACLSKYPFMQFGPRYTAATGNDLITGYRHLGKFAYWCYFGIIIGTMFAIQAAVTVVTAGLAEELFHLGWSPFLWSAVILAVCIALLFMGRYSGLDRSMKVIILVLTLATIIAVGLAFSPENYERVVHLRIPSYWNETGFVFLIALMGWMPIPLDACVWHTLWSKAKEKSNQKKLALKNTLIDFNIGFLSASFIGLLFLSLGALMLFGKNESFSGNSVEFSAQLIALYKATLGNWSAIVVAIGAFFTMFSTTLAVTDVYPRIMEGFVVREKKPPKNRNSRFYYKLFLFLVPGLALVILYISGDAFTTFIDFAAGLSFLASPFLAWFNYKLVTRKEFPKAVRPKRGFRLLSLFCFVVLVAFAGAYLYIKIAALG